MTHAGKRATELKFKTFATRRIQTKASLGTVKKHFHRCFTGQFRNLVTVQKLDFNTQTWGLIVGKLSEDMITRISAQAAQEAINILNSTIKNSPAKEVFPDEVENDLVDDIARPVWYDLKKKRRATK